MPRGQSKTSKRRVITRDREQLAFELRKQGLGYAAIGTKLGVSMQAAHQMVQRKLAEIAELTNKDAEKVLEMELERLDALWNGLWPKAKKGNTQAVEKAVKVMARRAALLGLDAPTKSDVNHNVNAEMTTYQIPDNGRGPKPT